MNQTPNGNQKNWLKTTARVIVGVIAGVILILAVLIGVFALRPQTFFNDKTIAYLPKIATSVGLTIKWNSAHVEAKAGKLLEHEYGWTIENPCVDIPTVPLNFCATSFSGGASLTWSLPNIVKLTRIRSVSLLNTKLTMGPFIESDEPSNFDIDRIEVPGFLKETVVEPSRLQFESFSLRTSAGDVSAEGSVSVAQAPSNLDKSKLDLVLSLAPDATDSKRLCWIEAVKDAKAQCLDQLNAEVRFGKPDQFVRMTQIGPLMAKANKLYATFSSTTTQDPKNESKSNKASSVELPKFLSDAKLSDIFLTIKDSSLAVLTPKERWGFRGSLDASATSESKTTGLINSLKLAVGSRNFCLDFPYLEGCFRTVQAAAIYSADRGPQAKPPLIFETLVVQSKNLSVLIPQNDENSEKNETADHEDDAEKEPSTFDWRGIQFVEGSKNRYQVDVKKFEVFQTKLQKRTSKLASGTTKLTLTRATKDSSQWNLVANVEPTTKSPKQVTKQKQEASLPERLRSVTLNLKLATGENPMRGPFQIDSDTSATFSTKERASLNVKGAQIPGGGFSGTVAAFFKLPTGPGVEFEGSANRNPEGQTTLAGDLRGKGSNELEASAIHLSGIVSPDQLNMKLNGALRVPPNVAVVPLPNLTDIPACNEVPPSGPDLEMTGIAANACTLKVNYKDGAERANLDWACPLKIDTRLASKRMDAKEYSDEMSLEISSRIDLDGVEDKRFKDSWKSSIDIQLMNVGGAAKQDWLGFSTILRGDLTTSQSKPVADLQWSVKGTGDIKIKEFKNLVELLKKHPYAIPAPFNVLEGDANLALKFDSTSSKGEAFVPFTFASNLKSPKQKLYTRVSGNLRGANLNEETKTVSLNTDIDLSEIAMTLPYIELRERFPLLFPDKRIRVSECLKDPDQKSSVDFSYNIKVNSPLDKPILISTNLTEETIPIGIRNLVIQNSGMDGEVLVNEFGFEVFRRKADVKQFRVAYSPGDESPVLDGKLEFKYTDITINLLIRGTAEEPIFTFESNPIRTEREIIAVLLYGQESSSFDDDQLQTADDLSAAFADQMIGLASLFVLAKTPIESVRYNPATKAFNAKVRLDGNTSLNLGTTREADQRVGLRHRLTSAWAIETDVTKDQTSDSTSGSALLEWSKRF